MRLLFFLTLAFSLFAKTPFEDTFPSSAEEIASLKNHLLIEGYVSPLSGQLVIAESDLVVKGASDLVLQRRFSPPTILGKYSDYSNKDRYFLAVHSKRQSAKGWVLYPHLWVGINPNSPYFQLSDPSGAVLEFEIKNEKGILKMPPFGFSNLRGEEPDSRVDLRNITLEFSGSQLTAHWPDGTKRLYSKWNHLYRLHKEITPNGQAVRYEYDNYILKKIVACDVSEKYSYGTIFVENENSWVGSDGRELKLHVKQQEIQASYKEGDKQAKCNVSIPLVIEASAPFYSNKAGYDERFLLNFYDAKEYPISCVYSRYKNHPSRIERFFTPSGTTAISYDAPIPGKKAGSTTVIHPSGATTVYRFNTLLLLEAVENWCNGKRVNQKRFSYDHKQHIAAIDTLDEEGGALLTRHFQCDEQGNPLVETLTGDFGSFSIRRKFDRGRCLFERRDDGLETVYTYLGDTWLLTSKTILDRGSCLRKTVYHYNGENHLVLEEEAGKTKISYVLYQTGSHLHRPEWQVINDWEGKLIRKVRFFYDRYGNTSKEEHFGSDGNLAYTIEREFDAKGNLLKETDPLGRCASYTYDNRGRPVRETTFSGSPVIERSFDEKGRLTLLKEENHRTEYGYNSSDELTWKVDYLGLKTTWEYDPVHGKPTVMDSSPLRMEYRYDAFGREISRSDSYGATTALRYNSYGAPLEIIDPDGGRRSFSYAPNGLLLEEIDPDGVKTTWSYDVLGRVLSKKVGERLTRYVYDAYQLLEEIDPTGIATRYLYNLAGQKVEEERAGRVTSFQYDSLGFLVSKKRGKRQINYKRNQIGQLLEQSEEPYLKTSWTYDNFGHVASLTREGTSYFRYDKYGRLFETLDETGSKTTIQYEEKDQRLIKRIVDPRGVETTEVYNAHGLLLQRSIPGALLEEFSYDRVLRCTRQDSLQFSYTPGGKRSSVVDAGKTTTLWAYTPSGKPLTEQKPTGVISYRYNDQGELIQKGEKRFSCDALGRLTQGTGFQRVLDPFGNILREEWENGLWIDSTYDDWDRVTLRKFFDGSAVGYRYEGPFLKEVQRYSAGGKTLYSHLYVDYNRSGKPLLEKGCFDTAYRYDATGRRRALLQTPYSVEKVSYDTAGNPIQQGTVSYAYDKASRLVAESSKFNAAYDFCHNCIEKNGVRAPSLTYDLNGNLLKETFQYNLFGELIEAAGDSFTYDALSRRIQKGGQSFLFVENEEIAMVEKGKIKELKVEGLSTPIAIEINEQAFAPICDIQGSIRTLVDWKDKKIMFHNTADAFGEGVSASIPYAYMGKRYDPTTGLVYFGKRYYDPCLQRWLTPDPQWEKDHSNLYQFLFNNPMVYRDPTGESIGGWLLGMGEILLGGALIFTGGVLEVATLGAYTIAFGLQTGAGLALIGDGFVRTTAEARNFASFPYSNNWRNFNYSCKKDNVDQNLTDDPDELLKQPDWEETTHPEAGKYGHRTFENKATGEKLRHDQGRPGKPGHEGKNHWHRLNPKSTSDKDAYLDGNGNPVGKGSDSSHLYAPKYTKKN
ncbi:MAG: RHS repeat-associated core domain-containing protein [Verrucomicrobiota bacterium]|nr:RHS repeat-associated core domain-containing protein [Verrucomicrobiota bacterium]